MKSSQVPVVVTVALLGIGLVFERRKHLAGIGDDFPLV